MLNLSIAPAQTVIGPGSLSAVGSLAARFGRRAIILGSRTAIELAATRIEENLAGAGVSLERATFSGECSRAQIERWAEAFGGYDVVLCVGGGKVLDTGKAAADRASIPYVTIPTSAATCAAATALVIIHSDAGAYVTGELLSRGPTRSWIQN